MTTPEKRPRGRPPTTGISPHLRVRVPAAKQARIREHAAAAGETVSDLVNRAIDRELGRLDRQRRRELPWQDGGQS